jgi:hypothetical protein
MPRPRVRFSVRWLMVVVSLLALGLAVVRHALTHWGPSEVTTIAVTALVATNILAWFQRARWQVFWAGFGLCGWAYLTFTFGSSLADDLPTTWLLDGLHDRLYANQLGMEYEGFFSPAIPAQVHADAFRQAGQAVFSLLFALLGGFVATALIPARAKDGEPPLPPEGSLLKPGWRDRMSGRS